MSRSPVADALTGEHRDRQVKLRAVTLQNLLTVWPLLELGNVAATWGALENALAIVIQARHRDSSVLASDYYRTHRRALGIAGPATPRLATPPSAEVLRSELAPVRRYVERLERLKRPDAAGLALTEVSGNVTRLALDGGRTTLEGSVLADREALGWARVTGPGSCAFCAMLCSRGPVYKSAGTAKLTHRGGAYHPHCSCSVEPAYEHGLSPQAEELRRVWNRATRGYSGPDALNAFRRELAQRPPKGRFQGREATPRAGTKAVDTEGLDFDERRQAQRLRPAQPGEAAFGRDVMPIDRAVGNGIRDTPGFEGPGVETKAAAVDSAMDDIRRLHHLGDESNLPEWIDTSLGTHPSFGGWYNHRNRRSESIHLNDTSTTPEFTFAHEFGHHVDIGILPLEKRSGWVVPKAGDPEVPIGLYPSDWGYRLANARRLGNGAGGPLELAQTSRAKAYGWDPDRPGSEEMVRLFERIQDSGTFRGLEEIAATGRGGDYQRYLREPVELWARAYSQWVATRTGSPRMRANLFTWQAKHKNRDLMTGSGYEQWPDDEFEPIAAAFDDLFGALGWT